MPNAKTNDLNERDTRLVQWLGEAHAKEAELEADLTAHIALTEKQAYKKRLRAHLTETKDHKRQVARRIKALGGSVESPGKVPGVPSAAGEVAGKAVAAVKGQVGTVRALVTRQTETHLRNAQEELREEHVEIAMYSRLEAFAEAVGDSETAKLARAIKRDEERMAKYLAAELERLTRQLVREEVPSDQRSSGGSRRRRSGSGSSSRRPSSAASRRSGSSRSSGSTGRARSGRSAASASR